MSGDRLDDLHQLVDAVSLAAGELDERMRLRDHSAPLGRARDGDPPPTAELEQPLVPELAQSPQDGVRVDLQLRGKVARRREPLSRLAREDDLAVEA